MAFYAGAIIREPDMENPTIVVITDRNDLDDQLFHHLLPLPGPAAPATGTGGKSRRPPGDKLSVAAGGVVFTTIQKFFPEERGDTYPTLSERRNIVVIADEAHRSQYDFVDGFARHMRDALPNASFVGFTGTPIELAGRQHPGRLRRLHQHLRHPAFRRGPGHGAHPLRKPPGQAGTERNAERPAIDPDFEEATEGEEIERKERLKTKWAQVGGRRRRRKPGQADCPGHRGTL